MSGIQLRRLVSNVRSRDYSASYLCRPRGKKQEEVIPRDPHHLDTKPFNSALLRLEF
jgi:hypothetical protein